MELAAHARWWGDGQGEGGRAEEGCCRGCARRKATQRWERLAACIFPRRGNRAHWAGRRMVWHGWKACSGSCRQVWAPPPSYAPPRPLNVPPLCSEAGQGAMSSCSGRPSRLPAFWAQHQTGASGRGRLPPLHGWMEAASGQVHDRHGAACASA